MKITKSQLRQIIKEELEAMDLPVRLDIPDRKVDPSAEHMDYTFYKGGDIAFYLIIVPSDMREGDSLSGEVASQLPAHDKYKIFGPSPAVMTKADTRRDGASDRIISADTLALGDRPELSKRKPRRYAFGTSREI